MDINLLGYIPNAEKILGSAGHATSSKESGYEFYQHIKPKEIDTMIKFAKRMKLGSVLDFPYINFCVKNCSRAATHQFVRHRMAAYMQQSLRYTEIDAELKSRDPWFVVPPTIIEKGKSSTVEYIKQQLRAGKVYNRLLKMGIPGEDSRFALPIGTKTHISAAMDTEEVLHIIYQRSCFDAQWEIRKLAYGLYALGRTVYPRIFKDTGPSCITENVCRGREKGRCKNEVKDILLKIDEEIDKRRSGGLDLTPILGYTAPDDLEEEVAKELGIEDINLDHKIVCHVKKY